MSKPFRYTEEHKQFIKDNYKGITNKELSELFNKEFNLNKNPKSMATLKYKQGLRSGVDARFKPKDFETDNELVMPNESHFKKGYVPYNHKKIGHEFVNGDGYVYVKTAEPRVYQSKHSLLWEKHHGKLKDGEIVLFLDNDKTNITIDNLEKITRSDLIRLNHNKLIHDNPEVTKAGIGVAKILSKLGELENER